MGKRKAKNSQLLETVLEEVKKLRSEMNSLNNDEEQTESVVKEKENAGHVQTNITINEKVQSDESSSSQSSSDDDDEKENNGQAPEKPVEKSVEKPPENSLEKPLEEEIIKALGEDPTRVDSEKVTLHTTILKRWLHWHANGLTKEEKEELVKRYPCMEGFEVPALNPELASKLQESTLKRDEHMMERQKIASSALTIIGSLMSEITHETDGLDKAVVVEKLNDTAKLLNQLMVEQINTRKAIVLPGIDKKYKSLLESAVTDKYLFGKDLTERIKTANVIEKVEEFKLQQPARQKTALRTNKKSKLPRTVETKSSHQESPATIQPEGEHSVQISTETAELQINVDEIAGRLRYYHKNWEKVTKDKFILNTIKGYKIRILKRIGQLQKPCKKFNSVAEIKEYKKAIKQLKDKGVIEHCKQSKRQYLSSYFLRPKSDGTKRFILNLKDLNKYVVVEHFKMENIKTAVNLVFPGNYMCNIDLQDAYYSVPICEKSRKYLRFEFERKTYQFTCLPNGQSSAPYIFTKILKPIVNYLRSNGCFLVIYLDDILVIAKDYVSCKINANLIIKILTDLGFIINWQKSNLIPSKRRKFFGFIIDSVEYIVQIPDEKRERLKNLVSEFLKKKLCKIREFAKFIGCLIAACVAFEYGILHTKIFERVKTLALENKQDYEEIMRIPKCVREDLLWWKTAINSSGNPIKTADFSMEIFSDASDSGWGATNNLDSVFGFWDDIQKSYSINYRELLAVKFALEKLGNNQTNAQILLRIDNTTAISYVNKMGGTRYKKYNLLAREIWHWAEERHNFLFASYISSRENYKADSLSRIKNEDTEWELCDTAFERIVERYGRPEVDLFANRFNKKCERFVSWLPDITAFEVDAFTIRWDKIKFYDFPPFNLVLRCLVKIKKEKASGIIVVPDWQNQPWYPLFIELLVEEPIRLGPNNKLLLSLCRSKIHPQAETLRLMAGRVS
ncbi:uncharacterized protein [Prorops nasuta]|uniref:uncharacterized protein n=1 Tax=Prorops nasuta TaxID=863751 RepID=UPI0034CD8A81